MGLTRLYKFEPLVRDLPDVTPAQRRVWERMFETIGKEIDRILQNLTTVPESATNVLVQVGGGGGSTGGGATNVRAGVEAASTSGKVVTFSSAIAGGYTLLIAAYNTIGTVRSGVGYDISGASETGFTITPIEDCTVEYAAIPHT